ncbi:DEAD/DEAH box helicase [Archangium violaceum]|uniref:AAA+ ATPase domain-containing protein n=1 Tax=Archangium violaceum Cb vi76 TaxID=1406225 RepID=A0A084SPD9_9BACT|nr:AAA domain-containing protein [Archangium violaceum]KFA90324.1 hypothetical protein Q664_29370 [Archangium violaceum Cb vi76]
MNIHEVSAGKPSTLEVEPETTGGFGIRLAPRSEALLQFSETTGQTLLRVGSGAWAIRGVDSRNQTLLQELEERNLPRLCWVAHALPKGANTQRVLLQVNEFPLRYTWPGDIDLGVDDRLVEQVRQKHPRLVTVASVVSWLTEKMLLRSPEEAGTSRVFLSGSAHPQAEQLGAFRLLGSGLAVDVVRGRDDRLRITRVVEQRRSERYDERRPLLLVEGRWRFCDVTLAGEFRGVARTQLDQLVERSTSYLHLWKAYNALERASILRRARAFGLLRYTRCELKGNGLWRFHLHATSNLEERLRQFQDMEAVDLEAAAVPPAELLPGASEEPSPAEPGQRGRRERTFAAALVSTDATRQTLDMRPLQGEDAKPPSPGVLFVSLSGDRKRLERREQAHGLIATAESPMPQLGLLIEGQDVPERRRRTEKALSAAARELFDGKPTDKQLKALEAALNTPDIALIQGPPGTGKTKVITALQVRLAEIEEKEGISGQTLLTSYQHDAVENAASKTRVFGLPAIKVGRRRGQAEEADTDGFHRWRRKQAEDVRADLAAMPERPVADVLRRVRNLAAAYVAAPREEGEAIPLLQEVSALAREHLPTDLQDRLLALFQELRHGRSSKAAASGEEREQALKVVRALRTEAVAFSDDGRRNARRVLNLLDLHPLLEPPDRELLERASGWDSETPPPFLEELKVLQGRLVDRLLPDQRPTGAPTVHADVETLLTDIIEALYRRVRETAAGPAAVLHDYLDDLEHDVEGFHQAVRDYTVVLAATCQQAVGYQMSQAKGDNTLFHNVIVDEAARANPLDLLIPMSRAERRIILVGDQRQLPHILEQDVESELDHSASEETREALRQSLFERLFLDMKKRQARDRIPRTVTLDVQYRMHPVLGEFVSDTFYKKHGEAFGSGRPASDFVHGLVGYGEAVAAWVDATLGQGREHGGQSKSRPFEARWIAQEVKRLAEQRPDLGFGVITFYSAQVQAILRELARLGMAEQGEDGEYRIISAWRETGDRKERLRVGTVDAFQGKEFDVVLLSMTRSNDLRASKQEVLSLRRKYGHLMLENRLCVAMSRQQRLLIVVGDGSMLRGEAAATAIPGLVAFRQLCEGRHGIVVPA